MHLEICSSISVETYAYLRDFIHKLNVKGFWFRSLFRLQHIRGGRQGLRFDKRRLLLKKMKNSDNGRCNSYTPMIDIFDEAWMVSSMKYVFQHMQELTLEVDVVTYIHLALLLWFLKNGDFEEMRIN
ncbi:hypothetical protein Syun_013825 [Stephania yunnanensis]|uniref:Uncharacterized protein n=1 Tax=Stephania yunnanensis TaxID=152371 RepID=A0AAP0JIY0_9MAGN